MQCIIMTDRLKHFKKYLNDINNDKGERTTLRFVQVWLEVVSINFGLLFGFGSGRKSLFIFCNFNLTLVFQFSFSSVQTIFKYHTCTKRQRCWLQLQRPLNL
jgi:hypothetical protein